MNRNEERRDLSKKVLIALLSADDGSPVSDMPTFQKSLAKLCVGYADALLDELDKREEPVTIPGMAGRTSLPAATGDVQVGDLVMVRDYDRLGDDWRGPFRLRDIVEVGGQDRYVCIDPKSWTASWAFARHLTDEERAQIKRI